MAPKNISCTAGPHCSAFSVKMGLVMHMLIKLIRRMPELGVLLGAVVIGAVFFSLTSPQNVPPVMLMIAFGLLLISIYCVLRLVGRAMGLPERMKPLRYHALVFGGTLLPVVLLALQSIGQLDVRSMIVLTVIFAGTYFYISRMYGDYE